MGVRGRFGIASEVRVSRFAWAALSLATLTAACAPQPADRTSGVLGGIPGSPGPGRPPPLLTGGRGGAEGTGGSGGGGGGPSGTAGAPGPVPGGEGPPGPSPDGGSPADAPAADTSPPEDTTRDVGPALRDALAASCNNLPVWRSGVQYAEGADIVHLEPRQRFECRPWPYTPWCALPAYEPGLNRHWPEAWIDRGRCPP
jgi:hypothetical protein